MRRTNIYFISDCHLGANYISAPRAHEQLVVRFLDSIKHDAEALYLLGDVLDYWYEYRTVVPRGHVRFFGKLAELSDAGVRIYWLTGNHDVWLFDYLRQEVGLTVLRHATVVNEHGELFLISHGDDVGRQTPRYRFMKWCFNSRLCQWLYAAVHPRWTYAIAHGWSSSNRTTRRPDIEQQAAEASARDLECYVSGHHASHPEVSHYVFGHLHLARQTEVDGADMVLLGDWISQCTYAVHDGVRLQLRTFDTDKS